MKCSECGFDSFVETSRCKKCGHVFGIGEEEDTTDFVGSSRGEEGPETDIIASSPLEDWEFFDAEPVPGKEDEKKPPPKAPAVNAGLMLPDAVPPAAGDPPAWKAELDQRVASFRKRRARTRGTSDSEPNLEFDFDESTPETVPEEAVEEEIATTGPGMDVDFQGSATKIPETVELGPVETDQPSVSDHGAEPIEVFQPQDVRAVEFVLDSIPPHNGPETASDPVEIHLAPMTQRFGAGLIDAGVLLLSGVVFTVIFWRAGGQVSSHPITLFILAFVTVFIVLVYFGVFTAIVGTTPGLLWMGIEVRSLRGGAPTIRQAVWRAFGCLVSASAMFLGFLWALFDSENLTWHDRMSETYLAPADANPDSGT